MFKMDITFERNSVDTCNTLIFGQLELSLCFLVACFVLSYQCYVCGYFRFFFLSFLVLLIGEGKGWTIRSQARINGTLC